MNAVLDSDIDAGMKRCNEKNQNFQALKVTRLQRTEAKM